MIINKFSYKQFLKDNFDSMSAFILVGGATLILYTIILEVLFHYLKLNFYFSITIAYISAVLFHFFSNRLFVFKVRDQNIKPHFLKYSIVLVVNYLITLILMYIAVKLLSLPTFFGVVASTGTTMTSNYFIFKYWTFVNNNIKKLEN